MVVGRLFGMIIVVVVYGLCVIVEVWDIICLFVIMNWVGGEYWKGFLVMLLIRVDFIWLLVFY